MRIKVNEPLTLWQLWVVLGVCIFGLMAIVVGMHYLRPYLDAQAKDMLRSQQQLDRQFERNVEEPLPSPAVRR